MKTKTPRSKEPARSKSFKGASGSNVSSGKKKAQKYVASNKTC